MASVSKDLTAYGILPGLFDNRIFGSPYLLSGADTGYWYRKRSGRNPDTDTEKGQQKVNQKT